MNADLYKIRRLVVFLIGLCAPFVQAVPVDTEDRRPMSSDDSLWILKESAAPQFAPSLVLMGYPLGLLIGRFTLGVEFMPDKYVSYVAEYAYQHGSSSDNSDFIYNSAYAGKAGIRFFPGSGKRPGIFFIEPSLAYASIPDGASAMLDDEVDTLSDKVMEYQILLAKYYTVGMGLGGRTALTEDHRWIFSAGINLHIPIWQTTIRGPGREMEIDNLNDFAEALGGAFVESIGKTSNEIMLPYRRFDMHIGIGYRFGLP